jgi:hypothetical protein
MSNAVMDPNPPLLPPWSERQMHDTNARIAALEAFACDVMRSQTFTVYSAVQADGTRKDEPRRTLLGNQAARILGLPEHPTLCGFDTEVDKVS